MKYLATSIVAFRGCARRRPDLIFRAQLLFAKTKVAKNRKQRIFLTANRRVKGRWWNGKVSMQKWSFCSFFSSLILSISFVLPSYRLYDIYSSLYLYLSPLFSLSLSPLFSLSLSLHSSLSLSLSLSTLLSLSLRVNFDIPFTFSFYFLKWAKPVYFLCIFVVLFSIQWQI